MRKCILFSYLLFVFTGLMAQNGQEGGGVSVMTASLCMGILLCLIGFGLSMFAWRKEGKETTVDEAKQKRADKLGFAGLIIGGVGLLCLLPLLFMLQSIVLAILGGFFLLGIGYVIYRIVK